MAGIYTRDNRQALLASALQNALNRREAAVARDEQRRKENFKILGDTLKSFGRAYETYGIDDKEKLKQLEAERDEVVAAQQPRAKERAYANAMNGYPSSTYETDDGYPTYLDVLDKDWGWF